MKRTKIVATIGPSSSSKEVLKDMIVAGMNVCRLNFSHGAYEDHLEILMDEASGNYFGKKLIVDYYYDKMPKKIGKKFSEEFNLEADYIKRNLYREANPNMYLASLAKFMFEFKDDKYIKKMIKKGFQEFFKYKVLPFNKTSETPVYFIGSIAHYFRDILEKIAEKNNLVIADVIQRPIDNLLEYHKNIMK